MTKTGETKIKKQESGRGVILALLSVAQLVIVLDFSIVQIALPTIRTELGISLADSSGLSAPTDSLSQACCY